MAKTYRGYRQIADVLQQRIEAGDYAPGAQLPVEPDLIAEFGVARDTVRLALAVLGERGLVVTIHGRGSFVRDEDGAGYGAPKYAQIVSAIREDIRRGRLAVAAQIPTEAELCERFDMSRVTVRRALAELEAAGILARDGANRRVVA